MWFNIHGRLMSEKEATLVEEVLKKCNDTNDDMTLIKVEDESPYMEIDQLTYGGKKVFSFVDIKDTAIFKLNGNPKKLWALWQDYRENCFQDTESVKLPF